MSERTVYLSPLNRSGCVYVHVCMLKVCVYVEGLFVYVGVCVCMVQVNRHMTTETQSNQIEEEW